MSWLWTRAPSRQWTLGDLDGPPLSSSGAGRRSTRCRARHLTSARLTSHSPGPSSFTPASGAPRPERTEACRRGGRCSFIGDALISPGSSTLLEYPGGSPRPRPPPPEKPQEIENLLYRFLTSLFKRYPSCAGRRPLEAWCMSFSFRIFLP